MTRKATRIEFQRKRTWAITLRIVAAIAAGAALLQSGAVIGQKYPSRVIRIATSAPGGSSDVVSRMVAQGMTDNMSESVVVENRGSSVAVPYVAKSAPDGYSLLYYGSSIRSTTSSPRSIGPSKRTFRRRAA